MTIYNNKYNNYNNSFNSNKTSSNNNKTKKKLNNGLQRKSNKIKAKKFFHYNFPLFNNIVNKSYFQLFFYLIHIFQQHFHNEIKKY